jgi:porphyrinogen peroxidase
LRAALSAALDLELEDEVVGLGASLLKALGAGQAVPGLRELPALSGPGVSVPSTPRALWVLLRGTDQGELVQRTLAWVARLKGCLSLVQTTDTFVYQGGRDLTGYEDGTENPVEEAASAAGILQNGVNGLDGSSFVAVQRWQHDLVGFNARPVHERNNVFGRQIADNEEFDEAPPSAHVKRAAQEDFSPPAFIVRRSMPFSDAEGDGILFIAFGKSHDAYEAVLRRMVGSEDGIVDGLFSFSRPRDGAYYWCPPLLNGKLDLRALQA